MKELVRVRVQVVLVRKDHIFYDANLQRINMSSRKYSRTHGLPIEFIDILANNGRVECRKQSPVLPLNSVAPSNFAGFTSLPSHGIKNTIIIN